MAGDTCRLKRVMCLLWTGASKSDPLPLQFWNKVYSPINLGDCWCLTLLWPHREGQHVQLGIFQLCSLQLLQSSEGRGSVQAKASWQKLGLKCLRTGICFPLRGISLNLGRGFSLGPTVSRNQKKGHPQKLHGLSKSHLLWIWMVKIGRRWLANVLRIRAGLSGGAHTRSHGLGGNKQRFPGSPVLPPGTCIYGSEHLFGSGFQ